MIKVWTIKLTAFNKLNSHGTVIRHQTHWIMQSDDYTMDIFNAYLQTFGAIALR